MNAGPGVPKVIKLFPTFGQHPHTAVLSSISAASWLRDFFLSLSLVSPLQSEARTASWSQG